MSVRAAGAPPYDTTIHSFIIFEFASSRSNLLRPFSITVKNQEDLLDHKRFRTHTHSNKYSTRFINMHAPFLPSCLTSGRNKSQTNCESSGKSRFGLRSTSHTPASTATECGGRFAKQIGRQAKPAELSPEGNHLAGPCLGVVVYGWMVVAVGPYQ